MSPLVLMVIANPAAEHLRLLSDLPHGVDVRIGNTAEFVDQNAPDAEVILTAGSGDLFRAALPLARRLRWVHSLWAGVENILSPEFIASPIPLTNGRGVFKGSLAEFAIAAILYFAKDLRRMVRNQEAGRWEQFDVEEIAGHTLGIVGYGEIGRTTAALAHALGMKCIAVRRNTAASKDDPALDAVYAPAQLREMLALSDYVLVATPNTPETRGMIGEAELAAMKSSAVIINVGRGAVIVEQALAQALENGRIKGAALDVFEHEPLPEGHPFYRLQNLLLSPHAADHTPGWLESAVKFFLDNFRRFETGSPLLNIVDKQAGY
jgi:phosphoglycerate dehydrogenase-like enzyme